MDAATERFVAALPCRELDVLEISGTKWKCFAFRSYRSVGYPEFDLCGEPLAEKAYDLVIAEQVLEHVLRPLRAARNVERMLKPGGTFLVTTPFLLRVHLAPEDCTRWTETGLRYLLAEAGFDEKEIETSSWGNRACIVANFRTWRRWVRWLHSLRNEPDFPVVVWAMARKTRGADGREPRRRSGVMSGQGSSPRVSVLMPAYNAASFIGQAIESILEQTWPDWELLVANDCSTDTTLDVASSYQDHRVRVVQNPVRLGYLRATNSLFSAARGAFVTFQDADDYSSPRRFETLLEAFAAEPELGLVGSFAWRIDSHGATLGCDRRPETSEAIRELLLVRSPIFPNTAMVRAEVLADIGGYRECFEGYSHQDYDWAARIAEKYEARNIPEALYYYRQHEASNSKQVNIKRMIGHDLARELARQRHSRGSDLIMDCDWTGFAALEVELARPYILDPSRLYREAATRFYWGGMHRLSFRCAVAAMRAAPLRADNLRVLAYVVRESLRARVFGSP